MKQAFARIVTTDRTAPAGDSFYIRDDETVVNVAFHEDVLTWTIVGIRQPPEYRKDDGGGDQ